MRESRWADQPGNYQGQNKGYELAHPNIHPIYNLLELLNGPVLQSQRFKISMTQHNNRIFKRSSTEGPVSIVQQRTEAWN